MTTISNEQAPEGLSGDAPLHGRKKLPLITIVNILLFCGLLVLYGLKFFGSKGSEEQQEQLVGIEERLAESSSSIAYVNSELLMEGYELAISMRTEFEAEQTRLENDLSRRQRSFQSEVESFQRSINNATISMEQAQVREQELMLQQQELMQLNDTYRERLATKEYEMNLELLQSISDFLARYNIASGHDYILGYSMGGGILYADRKHDITSQVLEKLNEEYRASK